MNADVGYQTPAENLPWSPEISLRSMVSSGIDLAILSFPAISAGFVGEENRQKTRNLNLYAKKICNDHPGKFGFFATLPFLDDTQGNIALPVRLLRVCLTLCRV
jgi:6-methylsalicylate decarboxylase